MATTDNQSLMKLFHQYKESCLTQILDSTSDKDMKIQYMTQMINDLLNQNQHLLELVIEVQESATDKSNQMHTLLEKTANKTYQVGLALSSYELEMKKLTQFQIPSFIECADLLEKVSHYVESLEEENYELKNKNEQFFKSVQKQNIEIYNYKNMVYDLMFNKSVKNKPTKLKMDDNKYNYLELVLKNKLIEEEENANIMVCANILDEIITSIEINNENDLPSNLNLEECDCLDILSEDICQFDEIHDINDNYELENEYQYRTPMLDIKSLVDTESNLNFFRPQVLNILSTILNELELKNSVIIDMRRQFMAMKSYNIALHEKYVQRGINILTTFIELKKLFDENVEFQKIKPNLMHEIDNEIKEILSLKETSKSLSSVSPDLSLSMANCYQHFVPTVGMCDQL